MAYTTIKKPSDYFNTKLYTGNSSINHAITGVGFQPDWLWIKTRDSATDNHNLFDVVRGASKGIQSNSSNAEYTSSSVLESFDTDGFTLGDNGQVNGSGESLVAWNWLAGGTGASNTDGSITSTVSANTTSGFSIVSYTGNATDGATVGHGLGAVPDMLIGKDLSDASAWGIWHKDLTNAGYKLSFNQNAESDDTALFGGSSRTAPTSSVFTLGSGGGLNGSNANIVYAFTSIKGYSKFGKYIGNGNADGTFIYTGFKPAFLITKKFNASGDSWNLLDATRNPNNAVDKRITPDTSDAEATTTQYDFLSNGFKVRASTGSVNTSGGSYIYMAFAEEPLVGDNPATAR